MELLINLKIMKRISTKTNVKPKKVYIKNISEWQGKSVGIVLSKSEALLFAEGLIKASRESESIDITIFPKSRKPVITTTYLK